MALRRTGGAGHPRGAAAAYATVVPFQLPVQPIEMLRGDRLEPDAGDAPGQHVGVDDMPVLRLGVRLQVAAVDPAGQVLAEGEIGRLDVAAGVHVAEQVAQHPLGLLPSLGAAAALLDLALVIPSEVGHERPGECPAAAPRAAFPLGCEPRAAPVAAAPSEHTVSHAPPWPSTGPQVSPAPLTTRGSVEPALWKTGSCVVSVGADD